MRKRIRLTDKEFGVIHRILVSNTNPSLSTNKLQDKEDWVTLSNLTDRAAGNKCYCGDSCTCGG